MDIKLTCFFLALVCLWQTTSCAQPPVKYSIVFNQTSEISYCHMSTIESAPNGTFWVAFQASKTQEGADDQAIHFTKSDDGGNTWARARIVVNGPQAIWGPVLHYDTETHVLWLFFAESGAFNRREPGRSWPGGDIKYITSKDFGAKWSLPTTLLTYYQHGNISKVTANKLVITTTGRWLLPFWQEKHQTADTGLPCSDVLVSDDNGKTWSVRDCIHSDKAGWLIENTLAQTSNGGLYQAFRTQVGHIWHSTSDDNGNTWTPASQTTLANPDSKVFLMSYNKELVLAYNPSAIERAPLALTLSKDNGKSWDLYAYLEPDLIGSFSYPTTTAYGGRFYTTYSVDKTYIKLAVVDTN